MSDQRLRFARLRTEAAGVLLTCLPQVFHEGFCGFRRQSAASLHDPS